MIDVERLHEEIRGTPDDRKILIDINATKYDKRCLSKSFFIRLSDKLEEHVTIHHRHDPIQEDEIRDLLRSRQLL